MNIRTYLFLSVAAVLGLSSCGNGNYGKQASPTTGWIYNDPEFGGFQPRESYEQENPPGMVFVEGGKFTMGRVTDDIVSDWNNVQRTVTVNSFYMDQYEVTNRDWKEYLHWLSLVFSGSPEIQKAALPDTTVWQRALAYNDPFTEHYFRHAAYDLYPVVGVSWEQIQDYCEWRTDRVNEKLLADAGIIEMPDFAAMGNSDTVDVAFQVFNTRKYQMRGDYQPSEGKNPMRDAYDNVRKTDYNDGILMPSYRLPTEAEWEYAAYGLQGIPGESNYFERRIYPWDGHSLRNPDKEERGNMYANFSRSRGDYMGISGNLNDGAMITAPVNSFPPNDWGLYNMAGNVNEWVQDVYRATSHEVFDEMNPFRGNRFQRPVMVDTVIDGKEMQVAQIDKLGRIVYEDYPDSTFTKKYATADLRNFKDGDSRTSMDQNMWKGQMNADEATKKLYSPDEGSPEGMLTTHISNTMRVYKGGGWRDRPYWLSPGSRRYLEESQSRDDLGFRCAMNRTGPTTKYE